MIDLQKSGLEIPVYDNNLQKIDSISIPVESIPPLRKDLLQLVYVYFENKARVPNRGIISKEDMSFSTKKISPQKGRGKARRGSIKAAPLRKGQKAHGPSGEVNYKIKINKKVRELALSSAFFAKIKDRRIIVIEDGSLSKMNKTSDLNNFLKNFSDEFSNLSHIRKKTIFFSDDRTSKIARNINNIKSASHLHINIRTLIEPEIIFFERESLNYLIKRFAKI